VAGSPCARFSRFDCRTLTATACNKPTRQVLHLYFAPNQPRCARRSSRANNSRQTIPGERPRFAISRWFDFHALSPKARGLNRFRATSVKRAFESASKLDIPSARICGANSPAMHVRRQAVRRARAVEINETIIIALTTCKKRFGLLRHGRRVNGRQTSVLPDLRAATHLRTISESKVHILQPVHPRNQCQCVVPTRPS